MIGPEFLLVLVYLCNALALSVPVYFVVFRSRFWVGAFAAWFFLCSAESYSLDRQWALFDGSFFPAGSPPADYTNIGIFAILGWFLVLLYCLILLLIRWILKRYDLIRPRKNEPGKAIKS